LKCFGVFFPHFVYIYKKKSEEIKSRNHEDYVTGPHRPLATVFPIQISFYYLY